MGGSAEVRGAKAVAATFEDRREADQEPSARSEYVTGMPMNTSFAELAGQLAEIGRQCYARGWALGTSGNFSAVLSRDPLRLAITMSGVDKGQLSVGEIVEIDERGTVVAGSGRPSIRSRNFQMFPIR